jgi:hypothetical protein
MKKIVLAIFALALIAPSYCLAQDGETPSEDTAQVSSDTNPRGLPRPHDGRGGGTGTRGGRRGGQNHGPCPDGGPGYGNGQGAGQGQNRQAQ